jgi:hydrogenase small subunit
MTLTRRKFLQICAGSVAAAGASSILTPQVVQALKQKGGNQPVIWLSGQSCTGCSVSLVNSERPTIAETLLDYISLDYHETLMASAGGLSTSILDKTLVDRYGEYILIVEGSIPTAHNGEYCFIGEKDGEGITILEAVTKMGKNAKAVVAVGSCASWGNIPAAPPNPTDAKPVSEILSDVPLVNVPGCPPHPAWMVGTLAHVLLFGLPELDEKKRPTMFFGPDKIIHDNCERRQYFDKGQFAKFFSDEGCMYELGCKGPVTHCDIPLRSWLGGVNWCIRSGGGCIGCTEPTHPGNPGNPLFERLPAAMVPGMPGINAKANNVGVALGVATAAGIAAHALGRAVTKEKSEGKEG